MPSGAHIQWRRRRGDTGRAMSVNVRAVGCLARSGVCRGLVALALTSASGALAASVAEASFPGRNGLIAFGRVGPPFGTAPGLGARTIWLADPRSGRSRQLTHVPGRCGRDGFTWHDFEPSFSASGDLVFYGHWDRCDPRTPDGIYAIRSDGTGRRLVWRATSEVAFPGYPALSPGGRLLAFSANGGPTFITSFRRPDRERELSLSVARYDLPDEPAWSSSGRLALTLGLYRGHIGTATAGGKDLRLVTRAFATRRPTGRPRRTASCFSARRTWARRSRPTSLLHAPVVSGSAGQCVSPQPATRTSRSGRRTAATSPMSALRASQAPRARCGRCAPPTVEDSNAS